MSKIIVHFDDEKESIIITNCDIDLSKVETITNWWRIQNPKQKNSELFINTTHVKYFEITKEDDTK